MPDVSLVLDTSEINDDAELVEYLMRHRYMGEFDDTTLARKAARARLSRIDARAVRLRVMLDGADIGDLWVSEDEDDYRVIAIGLAHMEVARDVRLAVMQRAVERGAERVTISSFPADPVFAAFAADDDFTLVAVQMRLSLAAEVPTAQRLRLEPMSEEHFVEWYAQITDSFAAELTASGMKPQKAAAESARQVQALLPQSLATADHHLFDAFADSQRVGLLWVGTERPMAYVYEVAVFEPHRRQGYGAELMNLAAQYARNCGAHAIGLNVFGHNTSAYHLYQRLGYETVEELIARPLG